MLLGVVAAVLLGVGLGALLMRWVGRREAPEPMAARRLTSVAPEVRAAPLHTRGNRPVDEVTRAEITRLLQGGRKMEAIRLLHASTDMSLLQAKARVEEWSEAIARRLIKQAYEDASDLDHAEVDEVLAEDLREILQYRGGRWRALRLLRRRTTMRLVDAWDYLESIRRVPAA
jgi:ribosomal protein L7/L12